MQNYDIHYCFFNVIDKFEQKHFRNTEAPQDTSISSYEQIKQAQTIWKICLDIQVFACIMSDAVIVPCASYSCIPLSVSIVLSLGKFLVKLPKR